MADAPARPERRNAFTRFLDTVEWLGNLLPHPVTLFALLALGIILLSGLFGWMGLAVEDPRPAGARGVADDGMTGPLLFFVFILMCAVINLSLGSASAQWAVTAPIFVPMLMLIGYSPEVIQAAYRIGDSTTNIITPMMSYFGLILAWATRYDRKLGVGTLIAMMLPYSIFFILLWSTFFFLWTFGLELPVGPGSPTYYPAAE